MIHRAISDSIVQVMNHIPVITITGPRQSGKTTLVKELFPDYKYVNLEFPDNEELALNDPRQFLSGWEEGMIIDEIQRVPELLRYIQGLTDEKKVNGKIILTGSHNISVMSNISQTLAGRNIIFTLLPFSSDELINDFGDMKTNLDPYLFKGFYPRIYDQNLDPAKWLPSYILTYLERDLRQMINIKDLHKFQLVLKLCAGRTGQLINYRNLSNETGVDEKTIKSWIHILEASYIIFTLSPYYRNFGKRQVKSKKLYFTDSGLLCNLLGIRDPDQLRTHYLSGHIFENFVISEVSKSFYNKGTVPPIYYWRDNTGNEVDLIIEKGNKLKAAEIKSSSTFHSSYLKNLDYLHKISGNIDLETFLIMKNTEHRRVKDHWISDWGFGGGDSVTA